MRPINIMTPADYKKADKLKGEVKEKFLKTKIFEVDINATYKELSKLYPALNNRRAINMSQYEKALSV